MKHTEMRVNNTDVIMETFANFTEFINVVESRETLWTDCAKPVHDVTGEKKYRGCDSYTDACHLLKFGITDGLNRMKSRVGELQKHGTRKKTKRFNDVVGYTPIVANALMGIPNAMVNCERRPVASKVITIVYEPSMSCGGTKEEVFEFGCEFVNAVMNLEENGYRVRIDYLKTNISRDGRMYCFRLPVKNEHQPINLKRLMFPMTHVAMQRYLAWEWIEKLPNSKYMSGYGRSLYGADSNELSTVKELLNPTEYLVYFGGSSVNDVLKQIDIEN